MSRRQDTPSYDPKDIEIQKLREENAELKDLLDECDEHIERTESFIAQHFAPEETRH